VPSGSLSIISCFMTSPTSTSHNSLHSSLGCKGQKEVVTLAHNNVFRDLMFDIARHQKKTSVKDFTTLDTEKTLGSLWEREEYMPPSPPELTIPRASQNESSSSASSTPPCDPTSISDGRARQMQDTRKHL